MNVYEEYKKKLVSAEEAVKIVKSGDWVDYSQTCSFPEDLDAALAARRDELEDVKVRNVKLVKIGNFVMETAYIHGILRKKNLLFV